MNQEHLLKKAELLASKAIQQPGQSHDHAVISSEEMTQLKAECDEAAKQLKELQTKLSQMKPNTLDTTENPAKKVLQERERMLISYQEAYKEAPALFLPKDIEFQQGLLLEKLEQKVAVLNDALAWVKALRRDIKEKIERESKSVEEKEEIKLRLEQRLEEVEVEGTQRRPEKTVLAEINKKNGELKKYYEKFMKYLTSFLLEHFPKPSAEEIAQWYIKQKLPPNPNVVSLLDILEEILNRSIEAPNNPYILVNDSFWPPYLQLLVRVGIVQRHPEDDNRIKMTPFHH